MVKSGRCLGSISLSGFAGGSRARSGNESVLLIVLLLFFSASSEWPGAVGAGISEIWFRIEVSSCLGVGRADGDEDILLRGLV